MFWYIENSTQSSDICILRYTKNEHIGLSFWTALAQVPVITFDCTGTGSCYQLSKIQLYFWKEKGNLLNNSLYEFLW